MFHLLSTCYIILLHIFDIELAASIHGRPWSWCLQLHRRDFCCWTRNGGISPLRPSQKSSHVSQGPNLDEWNMQNAQYYISLLQSRNQLPSTQTSSCHRDNLCTFCTWQHVWMVMHECAWICMTMHDMNRLLIGPKGVFVCVCCPPLVLQT